MSVSKLNKQNKKEKDHSSVFRMILGAGRGERDGVAVDVVVDRRLEGEVSRPGEG